MLPITPLLNMLSIGGVDLFFCISGFVITQSLYDLIISEKNKYNFYFFIIPFWIKRFFRLYPSLLLWVLIFCLLSLVFNSSKSFGPLRGNFFDGLSALLHLANVHFYLRDFTPTTFPSGWNAIYWSLSLEEQFYILFPLFLIYCPRRYYLVALSFLILIQFFIVRAAGSPLWGFRTDSIIFGILIFMFSKTHYFSIYRPIILKKWGFFFTLLLITLLCILPALLKDSFSTGLMALVCAVLVWVSSYEDNLLKIPNILSRPLLYIGSRSYSLYLIHMTVYAFTYNLFYIIYPNAKFDNSWNIYFLFIAFSLILLLSEINYKLIEKPLTIYGRNYASKYSANITKSNK